jgi:hypothetical protein
MHTSRSVATDAENPDAVGAVDLYNKARVVMTAEHYRIHQGQGYTATVRAAITDADGKLDILFAAPALCFPHVRVITVTCEAAPIWIDWYLGTTVSDAGTTLYIKNNNDNSTNTADLGVTYGPTITDVGALDEQDLIPALAKHAGVAESGVEVEYNMKPLVNRLVRFTNKKGGGATSTISIKIFFYEG